MASGDKATEHTIQLGKQHVAEQEARIERQKILIASLETDGHVEMAQAARQLLAQMTDAQAEDRLQDRPAV